jgi:single-strand DNA-binding protein
MISVNASGRITKDAVIRQAGSSNVCSFGLASNKKVKGEDVTTFVDVEIWGARGEKLCEYLTKGSYIVASGELSTREHNGKTYLRVEASGIEFGPKTGGAQSGGQRQERKPQPSGGGGDDDFGGAPASGGDDDIPFARCSFSAREPWWRD